MGKRAADLVLADGFLLVGPEVVDGGEPLGAAGGRAGGKAEEAVLEADEQALVVEGQGACERHLLLRPPPFNVG